MSSRRGAFILFEGVDRCGKTTQARKLVDALNASGSRAIFMRFPDRDTTIGTMINAYLSNAAELDDRAVHLLFSANRWERRRAMLDALRSGTHVVVDRYAHSGVCFSSAKPGLDVEWCKAPDAGLPQPDVVLFLDLSVEASSARGGFGGERYEVAPFQQAVRAQFAALARSLEAALPGLWVTLDAAGTIDEVHSRIRGVVDPRLEPAGVAPLRALWDGAVLPADAAT